ncbi:hypothetical protein HK100_000116 [Physocladia obscura]|uniref:GH16 domain-containing protein n=1 Tax=Physocladia obscura TaxID=109957 RepID=A0AAD5T0M6_9FUNG|nr:hypothetical protein HK100_000116 [Physocladia obscura]
MIARLDLGVVTLFVSSVLAAISPGVGVPVDSMCDTVGELSCDNFSESILQCEAVGCSGETLWQLKSVCPCGSFCQQTSGPPQCVPTITTTTTTTTTNSPTATATTTNTASTASTTTTATATPLSSSTTQSASASVSCATTGFSSSTTTVTTATTTTTTTTTTITTTTTTTTVTGYTLIDVYDSSNILAKVNFFNGTDPTDGEVDYVSEAIAIADGLAYTSNGVAYFVADNHTEYWGVGRQSVRWSSQAAYNTGLFIFDIAHMPTGCGTWPALWLLGSGQTWPYAGEIDVIEGVNTNTQNSQTLHTQPGCAFTASELNQTGTLEFDDCNSANGANNNLGCGVTNTANNSYGVGFNAIGGGVYATKWTNVGISIWFFPRNAIPSDITAGTPNPAGWGIPSSNWPFGSTCQASFFSNMQIVLDTTFCGDWAGSVYGNGDGCLGGTGLPACNWFVQHSPTAFDDAYWAINSLKVYSSPSAAIPTGTTATGIIATTTTTAVTAASTSYTFPPGQYWGSDCTYIGGDITNLPTTGALCGPACEAFAGCEYFVWTELNGGTCWLKDYSTAGPVVADTGVCGYLYPVSVNYGFSDAGTVQWANDCAWTGFPLGSEPHPDGSLCGGECVALSGCTHFQFNVSAAACDFFDSSVTGPVYQQYGMCGFTTPNPSVATGATN